MTSSTFLLRISCAALLLGAWGGPGQQAKVRPCHENPHLVGSCFTIHGRMSPANGSPGYRILRLGTRRILGVPQPYEWQGDSNYCSMPAWLLDTIEKGHKDIFADFTVCPITVSNPGVMQKVCVDSVAHVVTRHSAFFGP